MISKNGSVSFRMVCAFGRLLVMALIGFLPGPVQAFDMTANIPECTARIEIDGADVKDVREVTLPPSVWAPAQPQLQITAQGDGVVTIRQVVTWNPSAALPSDACLDYSRFIRWGSLVSEPNQLSLAVEGAMDMEGVTEDSATGMFGGQIELIRHSVRKPGAAPECDTGADTIEQTAYFSVNLGVFRKRNFTMETTSEMVLGVATYNIELVKEMDILIARRIPWPGARVTPVGEGVRFSPSTASTNMGSFLGQDMSVAWFHVIPDPRMFEDGRDGETPGVIEPEVEVSVDELEKRYRKMHLSYAKITAIRGTVVLRGGLGEGEPLQIDDVVAQGGNIVLMKSADGIEPMVAVEYFDGTTGTVTFQAREGEVVMGIGSAGVEYANWEPMKLEVKRAVASAQQNSRAWMQWAVESVIIDTATAGLSKFGRVAKAKRFWWRRT